MLKKNGKVNMNNNRECGRIEWLHGKEKDNLWLGSVLRNPEGAQGW